MRLAPKIAFTALVVVAILWLVFSWFEAEQEVRILCSMFHSGLEREQVVRTLQTGEYLRYRTEAGADGSTISVDSLYNLGSSRCVIEFESDRVVSATYE